MCSSLRLYFKLAEKPCAAPGRGEFNGGIHGSMFCPGLEPRQLPSETGVSQ
jgi:hypothetical protein